jgi:hypothetical protein
MWQVKPEPGAFVPALAQAGPHGFDVTADEIVAFLKAGPKPSSALTTHFKSRLPSNEHKKAFMALVKRVAKLEEMPPGSGIKCIVLRQS